MMTRQHYLDSAHVAADLTAAHHQYYGEIVEAAGGWKAFHLPFPIETIRDALATDEHMNNLPLREWDARVSLIPRAAVTALEARGDFLSLGTGVCILKEAARRAVEATPKP